jgi:hypothetical protein
MRFCVFERFSALPVTSVISSRTKYVIIVDNAFIETLTGIINRPNLNPVERRYIQLANISPAASMIAAGPPYNRKVRKISASEKLMANRERGSGKLIRGANVIAEKTVKA